MRTFKSFKEYLFSLVDDSLPEEEKKKNQKKRKESKDIPLGILKYMRRSNAGDA